MSDTGFGIFCLCIVLAHAKSTPTYESRRAKILREEFEMSTGGKLVLNEKETKLNTALMQWKQVELDEWYEQPDYYNFSKSYFEYKEDIKKSPVYRFIRAMPKGALLHVHANAVLGPEFFLNITYEDNIFACLETEIKFRFARTTPTDPCETRWQLMKDIRRNMKNVTAFDTSLQKLFTLEGWKYENADDVWKRFGSIFSIIYPLWSHIPVWEQYVYEMLKEIRKDNIFYVELRSSLPQMYDLDGRQYDELFFINLTASVVDKFKRNHPDFLGAKMICSFNRHSPPSKIEELLNLTKRVKDMYPGFIAGFDLVSREDSSPLVEFLPSLEAAKGDLDYFFHAGETNWYGSQTDENLVDAVNLGAKRIGHGFALLKHPGVMEILKQKDVCIEACVVSNAVLGLLKETRAHPLAAWIAQGLPVTLSGDDPGFWSAQPLTTDFYVTFQGIASRKHDLRLLKKLTINSVQYSAMNETEKNTAFALLNTKWKKFVDEMLENHYFNH